MPGYVGTILRVDLSSGRISREEPSDDVYRTYLGGRAMAAYLMVRELSPNVDPLGPENRLYFLTGPLTGMPLPGSGRNSVAALSPLTGRFGEGQVGGFFGAELKRAGFDHVVIEGQASKPVYLWIHDGQAEIRDATAMWGANTADTQEAIRADLGDSLIRTALIGSGGERLVRYACVMNDVNHAVGRSGMGAVMGSKRLKGIAVRGRGRIPVADPEIIRECARKIAGKKALLDQQRRYGTTGVTSGLNAGGGLPTRNFQTGYFEQGDSITGDALNESLLVDIDGCYACPLQCKRVVGASSPYDIDRRFGGPEYETIAAFGSNCGVGDLAAVCKANELCAAYGLDTISTGNAIAFAMECRERGLLGERDLDGLDLRFGSGEAMVRAVEMIAHRQGIGDLLAEGVVRAAKLIGGNASSFSMAAGGQEFPMHMPRQKPTMGLGYAVGPAGADHGLGLHDTALVKEGPGMLPWQELGILRSQPLTELSTEKLRALVYGQQWRTVLDSVSTCIFVPYSRSDIVALLSAATGWNSSLFELMKVGQRGITLSRLFNTREGFARDDDALPERCFEPLPTGAMAGTSIDRDEFENMVDAYYDMMGWDLVTGQPRRGLLLELDLAWAIQ
jgi:aldehyde:ferredoxin oxidoreductase